jgi:hypothetical protein
VTTHAEQVAQYVKTAEHLNKTATGAHTWMAVLIANTATTHKRGDKVPWGMVDAYRELRAKAYREQGLPHS